MTEQEAKLVDYWIEGEFPAAIWKVPMGTLCGYLGVPPNHPWYGKHYNNIDCDVHGGLTYSEHENFGHPAIISYYEEKIAEHEELILPPDFPDPFFMTDYYKRHLKREIEKSG